jgi:chromosome segregation ATPase
MLRAENQDITQQVIHSKMNTARTEEEKQQLSHELAQVKTEFEQYQKNMSASYQKQIDELAFENRKLVDRNLSLANQLTDTESMLINMKIAFAERESEFEALKRQLKDAKK